MPELPEVAGYRKYFEKYALGRKIASARVKAPRIIRGLTPGELEGELTGRTFISTLQHGKYLFAQTDGAGWLVAHFGMTGGLRYFEDHDEPPKFDRFLIVFETGGSLSYVNQRMFGWIGLTREPAGFIEGKGLGPSALDPGFDYSEFKRIFSGKTGEIKAALLNQKLVAGIGNLYADEILFQARLHPRTKIIGLGEKELQSVYRIMREVLRTAIETNSDIERLPRKYFLPHRKRGGGCPACLSVLQTVKAGGRTSYFCPRCQQEDSLSR
jgi:formamidopyrimidine-DNA glycosylase